MLVEERRGREGDDFSRVSMGRVLRGLEVREEKLQWVL